MKELTFGRSRISSKGPCYFIAEIGHNHQGNLETALKMIQVAASCGVQAVKFQKRNNRALYTKGFYNKVYDNENSFGDTYGAHREHLEFGMEQYRALKKCALENNVEFMATAFDCESVDFLEELGVTCYKTASGDISSTPLLECIAKTGKPMFISTGASTMEEVKIAYDTILKYHDKMCIMHCTAGYPTEYHDLNLNTIETFKREFSQALIGYSGHDNGILASVIAYLLGAVVIEKHFTLNHAWKGTDHKFSLEPEGLRKQIRDLRRTDIALGTGKKEFMPFEKSAREKMGKGVYAARPIRANSTIRWEDLSFKTPSNSMTPYQATSIIGKKAKRDLDEESPISLEYFE